MSFGSKVLSSDVKCNWNDRNRTFLQSVFNAPTSGKSYMRVNAVEGKSYEFKDATGTDVISSIRYYDAYNYSEIKVFLLYFDLEEESFDAIRVWYPEILKRCSSTAVIILFTISTLYPEVVQLKFDALVNPSVLKDLPRFVGTKKNAEQLYVFADNLVGEAMTSPLNMLLKKRDNVGSWVERYFSIIGNDLEYRINASDKEPKDKFSLVDCSVKSHGSFGLSVTHYILKLTWLKSSRQVLLATSSKVVFSRWMYHIQLVSSVHSTQSYDQQLVPSQKNADYSSPVTWGTFYDNISSQDLKPRTLNNATRLRNAGIKTSEDEAAAAKAEDAAKRERDKVLVREMFKDLRNVTGDQSFDDASLENMSDEDLENYKQMMIDNIDKVLERGEKVELLVERDEQLRANALKFAKSSAKLKKAIRRQKYPITSRIVDLFSSSESETKPATKKANDQASKPDSQSLTPVANSVTKSPEPKVALMSGQEVRIQTKDSVGSSSDTNKMTLPVAGSVSRTPQSTTTTAAAATEFEISSTEVQQSINVARRNYPLVFQNNAHLASLSQASPQTWNYLITLGNNGIIASQQYEYIVSNTKLYEYYTSLNKSITGVVLAAQSISSGLVKNNKKTAAEHLSTYAHAVAGCTNVPGLDLVSGLCKYLLKLSNDPERHRQVKLLSSTFPSIESHKYIEIFCREMTLLVKQEILLDAKNAKAKTLAQTAKDALKWLKYGDIASPIELYATSHASNLLKKLLTEEPATAVARIEDLNKLVKWAVGSASVEGKSVDDLLVKIRTGATGAPDSAHKPVTQLDSSSFSTTSTSPVTPVSPKPVVTSPVPPTESVATTSTNVTNATNSTTATNATNAVTSAASTLHSAADSKPVASADEVEVLRNKLLAKEREMEDMKKRMAAMEKNMSTVNMVIGGGDQLQALSLQSVSERVDHHMKASAKNDADLRDLALEVQLLKENTAKEPVNTSDSVLIAGNSSKKNESCNIQ